MMRLNERKGRGDRLLDCVDRWNERAHGYRLGDASACHLSAFQRKGGGGEGRGSFAAAAEASKISGSKERDTQVMHMTYAARSIPGSC